MSKQDESLPTRDISDKSQDRLASLRHHLNSQAHATRFRTPQTLLADYRSLSLRQFGRKTARNSNNVPTLIIPPLGVHDAGFVDLFAGHSLIATLLAAGHETVHLADWRPLTVESAEQSFDACLSDLAIAIDDLGGRVNLIGLSIGGLFALLLAARFPGKIEKLALAGTPVDLDAQLSLLTFHARKLKSLPADLVAAEDWLAPLTIQSGAEVSGLEAMQRDPGSFLRADLDALAAFGAWTQRKGDLSGAYLRELLAHVLQGNDIAKGTFIALGRRVDLKNIRAPLFILNGTRDEIAPRRQAQRVLDLVGTAKSKQRIASVETSHYGLFIGRHVLNREWRMIAGWLQAKAPLAKKVA